MRALVGLFRVKVSFGLRWRSYRRLIMLARLQICKPCGSVGELCGSVAGFLLSSAALSRFSASEERGQETVCASALIFSFKYCRRLGDSLFDVVEGGTEAPPHITCRTMPPLFLLPTEIEGRASAHPYCTLCRNRRKRWPMSCSSEPPDRSCSLRR